MKNRQRKNLEAKYYWVAIVTMILAVIIAGIGLFVNRGASETGITQGSNNNNTVINGDHNTINQSYTEQEKEEICENPLTFQSDDLCLAYTADLMGQEKYGDAIVFLRKCLQSLELSEEMENCFNFNLGLCLLTTGEDYNQAANLLTKVANQVKQAEVYYYLCHAYIRAKLPIDAMNAIEKAIELDDQPAYQELKTWLDCTQVHQ